MKLDPSPADVEALTAYAEQLRQGLEIIATDSEAGATLISESLAQCLQRLERRWPRNELAGQATLPTNIGRFEIEKLLGQGAFGIVYLARDPLLDRKVALKVPRWHVLHSTGLRERFRREGRATAALDHPGIVPIHELGDGDALSYIAFAYCEGPSLAEWLRAQSVPVSPRVAARIVQQLAEAMHYSHHRGVLHRDLKPNNVLLFPVAKIAGQSQEFPFVPRIVDFGLARLAEEELEATGTSGVVGTPLYMAPEQALGDPEQAGPAADIYSLGTILYELLSGRPPFLGTTPLEVLDLVRHTPPRPLRSQRPEIARDLETICLHCLEKQPADRYATAQDLAADLQHFLAGEEIQARRTSLPRRALRICQQPQRIRDAGLTIMATHVAVILSMFIILYMVNAGAVVDRPADFNLPKLLPTVMLIMFAGHGPFIYFGWSLLQNRLWAAWASFIGGAIMLVMAFAFVVGWFPAGVTQWDLVGGHRLFYPMMTVLLFLQTVMSGIALIALRAKR
ncbi:serine/threonine-protein kinase [Anatilimnocola floriformis]|uniref:serine/threonine-protein kinase n=1 Tax=Anatilimnocola floriformis TaxID=2948575 RepID=UPI0020C32AA9|nr:serine/threonine-protein kinase [Anatilimnocola floriformis]